MGIIKVAGKSIEVDEEGFLINRSDWNEDVAKEMARTDGLELTPEHWKVINFVREYFEEYQTAPSVRMLVNRAIAKKDYLNKRETYLTAGKNRFLRRLRLFLWAEFPTYEQYLRDGWRQMIKYAGLYRPSGHV